MSRYVDAEILKERLIKNITLTNAIDRSFNEAPSIDIVHCRECRHYHAEKYHAYCGILNIRGKIPPDPEPDDFCSYGERRTAIFGKHADQIIIDESYAGNRSEIPTGSERSK